jgi:hypothetical protein
MKHLARWIPLVIALGVLVAGATVPLLARAQGDPIATLDPVQGFVQRQPADADPRVLSNWETVTERTPVAEGDRIRTDGAGLAFLTFFEGAQTEIRPSSLVVVSTLDLPETDEDDFDVTLDVLVGHAISSVDVALDSGDRFEVHTPGATAVVRGTRWWTRVTPAGECLFGANEGTVYVIPHAPPDERLQPEEAEEPPVGAAPDQAEAPPAAAAAPMPASAVEMPAGMGMALGWTGQVMQMSAALVEDRAPAPAVAPLVPATCGDGICAPEETDLCKIDCPFNFPLAACGDGECNPAQGEDLVICPADCGPWTGDTCGDGACDPRESGLTCPTDCPADQYFAPMDPAICGNGTCDVTESALSCPADCSRTAPAEPGDTPGDAGAATPPDDETCYISGDNTNLRAGPSIDYPIAGVLSPGEFLPVYGVSIDGSWYAAPEDGQEVWAAGWVVTASGPCDGLPIAAEPPPPAVSEPAPGQPASGSWGECGSCEYCGPYPASECITNPEGECIWAPGSCRHIPEEGQPGLSVPRRKYTCNLGDQFDVIATYTPRGAVEIETYHATAADGAYIMVQDTTLIGPTAFAIGIECGGVTGTTDTITATMTDTNGDSFSTSFTVEVN